VSGVPHPFGRRQRGAGEPGGWWLLTEQLVRFAEDLLRPDLSGWRCERLTEPPDDEDAVVEVLPDWICEVISARNAGNDLIRKKRIHHRPDQLDLTVLKARPMGPDEHAEVKLGGARAR